MMLKFKYIFIFIFVFTVQFLNLKDSYALPICSSGENVQLTINQPAGVFAVLIDQSCSQNFNTPFLGVSGDGQNCIDAVSQLNMTADLRNFAPNEQVRIGVFAYGGKYTLSDVINDQKFDVKKLIGGWAAGVVDQDGDGQINLNGNSTKFSPSDVATILNDPNRVDGNLFVVVKKMDSSGNECAVTNLKGSSDGILYFTIR